MSTATKEPVQAGKKNRKANKTSFEKGKSGNPKGRPPQSKEQRALKALTKAKLSEALSKILYYTLDELEDFLDAPNSTALEIMVGSVIKVAMKTGDYQRLEFLLNRTIGKVTDDVQVNLPEPFIIRRKNGDEVILGSKYADEA